MIPDGIKWLIPWRPIPDHEAKKGMAEELYREVSQHHVLFDVKVLGIARRQDCDDALFELLDGSGRLAVVHLTFSRNRELDPRWPKTRIFSGWDDFVENCMKEDHNWFT